MARLTRTAKYAELREKLSQDREESLHTEDLSGYAEKLNAFTNDTNTVLKNNPVQETKPQEQPVKTLDEVFASMFEDKPKQENPTEYKTTIDTEVGMIDDLFASAPKAEEAPVTAFMSKETITESQPAQEHVVTMDEIIKSHQQEPVQEHVVTMDEIIKNHQQEPVKETVDTFDEIIKEHQTVPVQEEIKETVSNNFINSTFDEVLNYNKESGNKTLEQLSNSLIDQIRHPEEPISSNVIDETIKEEVPVVEMPAPVQEEKTQEQMDEEFANTVSLEIGKVLEEIKQQQASTVNIPVAQAEPVQETKTEEHPVKAIAEEEDVVEIKNISETLNTQKVDDVLDDTIPFNVNAVKPEVDDEDEEEDEEEEAPSKVLNVILGVLIFVLVAVLGVIVYYILVAKGIIG